MYYAHLKQLRIIYVHKYILQNGGKFNLPTCKLNFSLFYKKSIEFMTTFLLFAKLRCNATMCNVVFGYVMRPAATTCILVPFGSRCS